MANRVQLGDIGTKITLNTIQYVNTTTVWKIYYEKSDGTTGNWTAVKESTLSISYTTLLITDLNVAGEWKLQAYVESPAPWKGWGKITYLEVLANLV